MIECFVKQAEREEARNVIRYSPERLANIAAAAAVESNEYPDAGALEKRVAELEAEKARLSAAESMRMEHMPASSRADTRTWHRSKVTAIAAGPQGL